MRLSSSPPSLQLPLCSSSPLARKKKLVSLLQLWSYQLTLLCTQRDLFLERFGNFSLTIVYLMIAPHCSTMAMHTQTQGGPNSIIYLPHPSLEGGRWGNSMKNYPLFTHLGKENECNVVHLLKRLCPNQKLQPSDWQIYSTLY